ncbi:polysaccharide pyruvyl transferase family protein [Nitrosopumilus sp.]|uniref:polysaccharide pyruvyl transferase family protein n=1 Tax=Nitrosopumilus sp. TaxID=2024843 RepID=UPI002604E5A0|nr:polysaccharide pyruvyl transferase family protein [Nitrosopumilus sp.]
MYAITIPTSTNVGDYLISKSAKRIIKEIKGDVEIIEFPMQKDLQDNLKEINECDAMIIPHFAIRDPGMYPETYRLVKDLKQIKVPIFPLGAGWKGFPGDYNTVKTLEYSPKTRKFLQYIANQVETVLCRDYFTCQVLKNHNISNVVMGGDIAWYDFDMMGKEMNRKREIKKIVFTTPHAPWFNKQAMETMKMLEKLYPNATKICAMHSGLNLEDDEVGKYGQQIGFEVRDVSKDLEKIEFYKECDLHVGYRLHAHIFFLRNRNPSVLLHEDGRGTGFSYTVGIGGFDAFKIMEGLKKKIHFATHKGRERIMAADMQIPKKVKNFLEEENQSYFRRYVGIPKMFDQTFQQVMKPWIESIP